MRRAAVALICLVARAAALSSSRMPRSPTREAKEANAVLAAAGERLRAGDAEQATRFLATGAPELLACDGRARRRNRSTLSAEGSRGATWIFCGDGSRRRRGCHVDIPRRRVAATRRRRHRCGGSRRRRGPRRSRDRDFLAMALLIGSVTPLNNMSLQLNPLPFYQTAKLSVTPVVVVVEYVLDRKVPSSARALSLALVCLFVIRMRPAPRGDATDAGAAGLLCVAIWVLSPGG